MAKTTVRFVCQACAYASPKWQGRCPECGEWNSLVEEAHRPAKTVAAQIKAGRLRRGTEPEQLALAFIGLLFAFGVLGPTRLGTTLEHPDRAADLIVSLFLDGVMLNKKVKPEKTPRSKKMVSPKGASNGKC